MKITNGSKPRINMIGKKFEKIKILKYSHKKDRVYYYECECSCGKKFTTSGSSIRKGDTKSCGCIRGKHRITHGLSNKVKEYNKYLLSNPHRRLKLRISNSIRKKLRVNNLFKNGKSSWKYLSYTPQELKSHLEKLWEPWMNWDNYGGKMNDPRKTWHIDHITPHDNFKYTSIEQPEFSDCWALSNLRPLEKIANVKKGKTYEKRTDLING